MPIRFFNEGTHHGGYVETEIGYTTCFKMRKVPNKHS
jgi:hypothetical protein